MLTITEVPLSVLNRALDLFDEPAEPTVEDAQRALLSAQSRKDNAYRLTIAGKVGSRFEAYSHLTPFAVALAEYLSLSGPWDEEQGEHAGEARVTLEMPW